MARQPLGQPPSFRLVNDSGSESSSEDNEDPASHKEIAACIEAFSAENAIPIKAAELTSIAAGVADAVRDVVATRSCTCRSSGSSSEDNEDPASQKEIVACI